MFEKLNEVESRYEQINQALMEPGVADEQTKYRKMMKELSELEKVVSVFRQFKKVRDNIQGNKQILSEEKDEDMRAMAKEELSELEDEKSTLEDQLKILLLPKDPNDEKDVILEIRAGAGGDEASLFASELFRAYTHYASTHGWSMEIMSLSEGNAGGYKEVIAEIHGEGVYSRLKFESGVHRVQRVPKTEASGRIHTSTVTVAVIPEAEENEIKIDQNDLRIDVMRASGAGGQSVNRTESAVRVTHIPSGIVVYCQEGKSQHSNRDKALKILYSRLLALEEEKARKEASDARLSQIGTGDRSERIRTYNFPQTRITDHRIGLTVHSLNEVMGGDINPLIDPLITHFQAEALKNQAAR
ncbi:MAG TPA: peptide chain release factor 1 [Bdellovibrionales bacterium]|nr:peptide chain release factor 1 [Bdellovibrionales bacterium]